MSSAAPLSAGIDDPVNQDILAVAEDRIQGFVERPFAVIADMAGVAPAEVKARIRAMLAAGTIRRVRQTLMATNLAPGALVAWQVPVEHLNETFDFMATQDPFSGHVVIRTTDADTPGSQYRLWTTLKVPLPYSMTRHCDYLLSRTAAGAYRFMPAKKLFKLGVGHMRRRSLEPGARADEPGAVQDVTVTELSPREWDVLVALKRELAADEIVDEPWRGRATEAGVSYDEFCAIARQLDQRRVIGRFSTFLEHVKKLTDGSTVTRYNALFHWAVPPGREIEAGQEVGRHHVMTHAYWREGGPQFRHVNIMGVAHGQDREFVLAHKRAIDQHLHEAGIPVNYTAVFWGGRSEIKPSEISPHEYRHWCRERGMDPDAMR